jgi:hypothetical protein
MAMPFRTLRGVWPGRITRPLEELRAPSEAAADWARTCQGPARNTVTASKQTTPPVLFANLGEKLQVSILDPYRKHYPMGTFHDSLETALRIRFRAF